MRPAICCTVPATGGLPSQDRNWWLELTPSTYPLAEVYRPRVAELRAQLSKSGSPEIREALRALISRVKVHAVVRGEDRLRIEMIGHLAALLRAGGTDVPAVLLSSVKVDAGTGFEPVTFRL